MKYKNFFKGLGFLAIIAFAVGILSLSFKSQKTNTQKVSMQHSDQQMITMMQQHHDGNLQDNNLQKGGSL